MRIAKPLLLVSTPIGVGLGLFEAWRLTRGLAFLMAMMMGLIAVAIASVVRVVRAENAAARPAGSTADPAGGAPLSAQRAESSPASADRERSDS